jgi:hypothetical protein
LFWVDILQFLGEFEVLYKPFASLWISWRKWNRIPSRGYTMNKDNTKAKFHLSSAFELWQLHYWRPISWFGKKKIVHNYIAKHKKKKMSEIARKRFGLLGQNISYSFSKAISQTNSITKTL